MLNESTWRLVVFAVVLLTCMVAERIWRRESVPDRRGTVISANLAMGVLGALLLRLGLPWLAMDAAAWAQASTTGLLNLIELPGIASFAIGLLLLELAMYLQHRASHRVPILWRLHVVHHSEAHLDASSSLRFHPLEALLSMLWKISVVVAFGIDPASVLVFEITLNAMAAFNHANLRLSPTLNRLLGTLVVTPDLHRLHHVIGPPSTAVNFGFNLVIWDRLFGSLARPASVAREAWAPLGAAPGAPLSAAGLGRLLWMPFSGINQLKQ
jgi:sterol desaturase/sphingolipid hydroxylase (fatty acid hydroxylase superfamily)